MPKETKRRHLVYVLGTEGCGKTSLLAQLQYMSEGKLCATPQSYPPTAGQNIHHLSTRRRTVKEEKSDNNNNNNMVSTIEVRELGGTMAAMWRPFIAAQLARESAAAAAEEPKQRVSHALCFVVDALAPQQLGLAACLYRELTGSPDGVCNGWPTLLVLQRCAGPHCLTCAEVMALFSCNTEEEEDDAARRGKRANVTLLEADSWSGRGLGDVWDWMCASTAAAAA